MIPIVETPTQHDASPWEPSIAEVSGLLLSPAGDEGPSLLHEFFDRAAERYPDRIAIDAPPASQRPNRRKISYADLKRQADALASHLRDVVKEECVVAILLPRSSEHLY